MSMFEKLPDRYHLRAQLMRKKLIERVLHHAVKHRAESSWKARYYALTYGGSWERVISKRD